MLRAVASQECGRCDSHESQAAHRNEGKGMQIKVSDALVAALCPRCHHEIDQGKDMTREERRREWDRAYVVTMQRMIERGVLVLR